MKKTFSIILSICIVMSLVVITVSGRSIISNERPMTPYAIFCPGCGNRLSSYRVNEIDDDLVQSCSSITKTHKHDIVSVVTGFTCKNSDCVSYNVIVNKQVQILSEYCVTLVHPIDISLGAGITYDGHQLNARDFGANEGTNIYATMAGTITQVVMSYPNSYNTYQSGGTGDFAEYGNYIDITVADGTIIRYAHQIQSSLPGISCGSEVYAGQHIGFVGNTGYSQGNHLHFETIGSGSVYDYFKWQ